MGKSDTDDDAAANVTGNGCGVGGRHNHDCAMRSTEAGMAVGAAVAEGAEAATGVSEESSVLPPPPSSWQRQRSSSPLSTTPRTARTHEERMALKIARNARPRHSSTGTGGKDDNDDNNDGNDGNDDDEAEWNVPSVAGAGAELKITAVERAAASAAETSSSSFAKSPFGLGLDHEYDQEYARRRGRTSEERWRDKISSSEQEQGQGRACAVAATAATMTREPEAEEGAAYRPLSQNWDRKVGADSGLGDNDRGKDDDYLAKCAAKSGSNMEQARAGAMEGEGTRGKRGKKQSDDDDDDSNFKPSTLNEQRRVEGQGQIGSNDPQYQSTTRSYHQNSGRVHVPSASPGAYSFPPRDPAAEAAAAAAAASSSTFLPRVSPSGHATGSTMMPSMYPYDPRNFGGGDDGLLSIPMAFRGELVPQDDDVGANGGQSAIVEAVDVQPLSQDEIINEEELRRKGAKGRGLFFNPWHWWSRKEKIMFSAAAIGAIVLGLGLGLANRRGTDERNVVIVTVPRPCDIKGPWRKLGDDLTHAQAMSNAKRPSYVSSIFRGFGSSVSLSSDGSILSVTGRFSDGVSVFRLENVTMNVTEGANNEGGDGNDNATEAIASYSKNSTDKNVTEAIASYSKNGSDDNATEVIPSISKNDTDTANVVTTITKEKWVQLGTDIVDGPVLIGRESELYDAISASVLSGDGGRVAAMFPHYSDDVFTKRGLIKVYEYVELETKEGGEGGSGGGTNGTAGTSSGSWKALGDPFIGTYKEAFLGDKGTVSLSYDGTVIAVGDYRYKTLTGRVRVYRIGGHNNDDDDGGGGGGGTSSWTQLGDDLLGESPGDNFGIAVSMSSDGKILGIGAAYAENSKGWARMYRYDEDRGAWALIGGGGEGGADDGAGALRGGRGACYFGAPLSMSSDGRRVAIYSSHPAYANATGDGAAIENGGDERGVGVVDIDCLDWSETEGNIEDVGIVRIYELSEDGSEWSMLGDGLAGDAGGESFGWAIDLSGDGETLAVGASSGNRSGIDSGFVRTYHHLGEGNWAVVGRDINGTASGYWAGDDVSLSENGEKLAIGSPTDFLLPVSDFEEHPQDRSGVAAVWHHCL